MIDDEGKCNIVFYGIHRWKHIAWPAMAVDIHASVLGFDSAILIKKSFEETIVRKIKLEVLMVKSTDSRQLSVCAIPLKFMQHRIHFP